MQFLRISFVLILFINSSFAQITAFPKVDKIPAYFTIESVEIEDKYTIVTASFIETRRGNRNGFVKFPSSTFLYNNKEVTSSNIVKNVTPFGKDVEYITQYGKRYRVFLFFDKIPAGVEEINIKSFNVDNGNKWFEWTGIKINNPLDVTKTKWREDSLMDYFTNNIKDPREGIYESVKSEISYDYKVGVIKDDSGFKIIFLNSDNKNELLKVGDVKADLTSTANNDLFKVNWVKSDGRKENKYFTFSEFGLDETISEEKTKISFIKLFPKVSNTVENIEKASGTGFLINSDGYIATNYHVIEDAKIIKVKGLNGDFDSSVTAKLIISDINNDLAIIKVDNKTLKDPPYPISSKKVETGNSIFCLGYPLRATMGDEVKVTNGIISSNTGFKNDISLYQISAPIQSGNSGGPLIDAKGNLIGIINAKHTDAENVSYAIKAAYLINLINLSDDRIRIQQLNKLSTISLPEKIKLIKNSTYIIEVEY
jgi:hypothetical protein